MWLSHHRLHETVLSIVIYNAALQRTKTYPGRNAGLGYKGRVSHHPQKKEASVDAVGKSWAGREAEVACRSVLGLRR